MIEFKIKPTQPEQGRAFEEPPVTPPPCAATGNSVPASSRREPDPSPAQKAGGGIPLSRPTPRRLFCWSAGGLTGLDIHAGISRALARFGVKAAAHSGTSAGAVFAAWHACGNSVSALSNVVAALNDSDVRGERFAWKLRIPWINSFLSDQPIRKLLGKYLPSTWTHFLPCSIWATRVSDGAAGNVACSAVSPVDAIMASMAIGGVFPAQTILEEQYIDGGCGKYAAVPPNLLEYDEIWMLVAQTRPSDYRKKTGILTWLMANASWALWHQTLNSIALARALAGERVRVVWPQLHSSAGALRFDHSLIKKAEQDTTVLLREWGFE